MEHLSWNTLSPLQKEVGIAPEHLSKLTFDISPDSWSPECESQIKNFFAGCLLAASSEEYEQHIYRLIDSPLVPQPVKAIAEKTLKIAKLQERIIHQYKNEYVCPLFTGVGCGSKYCAYEEKFGSSYNHFINLNLAHLMHPARIKDLLVSDIINKDIDLAERLISYRCYGEDGFQVAEFERALLRRQQEKDELNAQLKTLKGPHYVNQLELADVYLIPGNACQNYVCMIFNSLCEQNKLQLLDLPIDELYKHEGLGPLGGPVHQELEEWVRLYKQNTRLGDGNFHFGEVVRRLKSLAKGDLNALKRQCINDRIKDVNFSINVYERELANAKENRSLDLSNLASCSEKYTKGDFSFLNDELTIRILTNTYNAVEKLKAWSFFDIEPPRWGYIFWDHPILAQIRKEIASDHTADSISFCMTWMKKIHTKGWNTLVTRSLATNAKKVGMLELMRGRMNGEDLDSVNGNLPAKFFCPIIGEVMNEPFIAPDGHTYEKWALTEWLEKNPISPLTRKKMTIEDCELNYNLLAEMELFKEASKTLLPSK